MLEQILISILEKKFDQIRLANELNITQEELKIALEQLCITGYLERKSVSSGSCSKRCTDCNHDQDCQGFSIYTLTVKGRNIAQDYFL